MKLSPKAVRFVIEALEHYQKYHDEQLATEGLSDLGGARPSSCSSALRYFSAHYWQ